MVPSERQLRRPIEEAFHLRTTERPHHPGTRRLGREWDGHGRLLRPNYGDVLPQEQEQTWRRRRYLRLRYPRLHHDSNRGGLERRREGFGWALRPDDWSLLPEE